LFIGEPRHLQQLSVKSLDLSYEPVGDPQLARLSSLRGLEEVNLSNTLVSTGGVMSLKDVPLTSLILRGVRFHDYGVNSLPRTLRTLDATNTPLTDAGATNLLSIPGLQSVKLCGSTISPAVIATLRRKFSEVEITVEP
jgi:hypothetical protein